MKLSALLLICFLFPCFASSVIAQGKLSPEKPRWGQTITVSYDVNAPKAALKDSGELFAVLFLYSSKAYSGGTVRARLEKRENIFSYQFQVPKDLAYVQVFFVSPRDSGSKLEGGMGAMIYRPDGTPARGAYHQSMNHPIGPDYEKWFASEIQSYPDNYSVYRDRWLLTNFFNKDALPSMVKEDMKKMTEVSKGNADDSFLRAISYGYLLLKDEEHAREALAKLMERWPTSEYTGDAFSAYEYESYGNHWTGPGPSQVKAWERTLSKQHPETVFARLQLYDLANDPAFPLEICRQIAQAWMKDEPDNPRPYSLLAGAYLRRNKELEQAAVLIEKAITLRFQGKARLYDDLSGKESMLLLGSDYLKSAEIALQLGHHASAIAAAKAAEAMDSQTGPEAFMMEARIWQAVGDRSRVETAYREAYRRGSPAAEASLRALYQERNGTLEGIDAYLSGTRSSSNPISSEKPLAGTSSAVGPTPTKLAAAFNVKTLDGVLLDSQALRGKIVVINFWFVGCAPCKAEIPELNKLVAEFKGKDVAFIAFALDDPAMLKRFLKEIPFAYNIVPNAEEVARKYPFEAYPAHFVLDREGRIESMLIGAGSDRLGQLRTVISRLLKSAAAQPAKQ